MPSSASPKPATLQPLSRWPQQQRQEIRGVFTDIDDTLTTHGRITPQALGALADLRAAGLRVVAITGRPIGWCAPWMHGDAAQGLEAWPVDAMVAENGAVAWVREADGRITKRYQQDAATRAALHTRMQTVAAQVQAQVPGAHTTRDSAGRETDVAFDYREFADLTPAQVQQVLNILQDAGMYTSVSSIHIHGCFADFNKWQGACWIARTALGCDLVRDLAHWVFVGDSGNDQAMFAHMRYSVGVANLQDHAAQLTHLPTYLSPSPRGAGFAEVAQAILQARTHACTHAHVLGAAAPQNQR